MRYLVVAMAAALLAAAGASAALESGGSSLHATLTGKAETPKGDPDGSGTAEIKITGRQVCWEIKVARVQTIQAAHIHKGRPGVEGPVVVPFGKTFKAKGCTTTTSAIAAAIKANPRGYYVNVHNVRYPAGALRGQLHADA
jgi:hypothetical protein